jgi:hypothetical protein
LYLDVGTSVADLIRIGKELESTLAVLHSIIPGDTPPLFYAEDTLYIHSRAYRSIGLLRLCRRHTEAPVKTGQEITQDQVSFRDITGPAKAQLRHQTILKRAVGSFYPPFGFRAVSPYVGNAQFT